MPIFTGLSPNAQKDDVCLAIRLIFQPWLYKKGNALNKLQKSFQDFFSLQNIFFFESGRTALFTLLSTLKLQPDNEVLLQSYTCVAVPEPVLWVKARPVYVDIDEETLTISPVDLEKKITSRSKVLIIQHTFGQPADLEKLLDIAKKHNLFVIEDCAHALGATYQGKKVGTFGDASFFSFGRDKVISSVFGGALAIQDKTLAQKVHDIAQTYSFPSYRWILQQLLHPIVLAFGKATYSFFGKFFLEAAKRLHIISKAVYQEERHGEKPRFIGKKFPNALAHLALHQFQKLEKFNQHRQDIAKFYSNELQSLSIQIPPEKKDCSSLSLRYTIQTDQAQNLFIAARKKNIYLGDWYRQAIAPANVDYKKIFYDPLLCPNAEKVAKKTVNLPTDIHISKKQAKHLIQFLKNFYGN